MKHMSLEKSLHDYMIRILMTAVTGMIAIVLAACGGASALTSKANTLPAKERDEEVDMVLYINDEKVNVSWEDNSSVDALKELVSAGPLSIDMSMYGGFEQVGSIGQSLPREDKLTTTSSGDIVLYSGDKMVVFYGSNSWSYTKLGHIIDKDDSEIESLLSNGDVTITLKTDDN